MEGVQPLIIDLALILILAGIVTLVFKRLRQPVVLGYIVAGFLASPNFHYLPSIVDTANINIWAEIGIIILLFTLGLEFNFKKLLNVGGTAFTTALTIAIGMIAIGYMAGQFLGFTTFDSIFLGAMMSMSSTMIIIKAFGDLGLRQQKFTQTVFGVLIVQDLLAVVLLVILSSIAVGSVEGGELLSSIGRLIFFLVLWFVIGTFIIPTFIRAVRRYLNNETLLIVSMGLCFGMVVLANYAGFSSALGAFVMGSILSSANEVERMERIVKPIKDLFGAVFFISVGMLVNVDILVEYALPIIILSLVVILGQSVLATFGMLLSGQPLRTAIQSGFSLSQIGEFSFIIASLGISLGVMNPTLYPIIVAVSVVTTFTTPYMIKLALPFYNKIEKHIPERIRKRLDDYAQSNTIIQGDKKAIWKRVILNYIGKITIFCILILAIMIASRIWLFPFAEEWIPGTVGTLLATIATLMAVAPFLWAITMRRTNNNILQALWSDGRSNQVPIMLLIVLRYVIAIAFVLGFLHTVYSYVGMTIGAIIFILLMKTFSKDIQKQFTRLEKGFLDNLNLRERSKKGIDLIHDLHIARMKIHEDSELAGVSLANSNLRKQYGVNIVSILRGTRRINIPGSDVRLFPGDIIRVIGTDEQIARLLPAIECGETIEDGTSEEVKYSYIIVGPTSDWIGKSTADLGLRNNYHCLLIGIERGTNAFLQPDGTIKLEANDILWVAGEPNSIKTIKEIAKGND